MKDNTPKTLQGCEFKTDHNVVWAGDGYFCSKCMLEFIPNKKNTHQPKTLQDVLDEFNEMDLGRFSPYEQDKIKNYISHSITELLSGLRYEDYPYNISTENINKRIDKVLGKDE